jgi:hypothetical protein
MNTELGLWKSEECALVLIDYQPGLGGYMVSNHPVDVLFSVAAFVSALPISSGAMLGGRGL